MEHLLLPDTIFSRPIGNISVIFMVLLVQFAVQNRKKKEFKNLLLNHFKLMMGMFVFWFGYVYLSNVIINDYLSFIKSVMGPFDQAELRDLSITGEVMFMFMLLALVGFAPDLKYPKMRIIGWVFLGLTFLYPVLRVITVY